MFGKRGELKVPRKKFYLGRGEVGKSEDIRDLKQIIGSLKNLHAEIIEDEILRMMQDETYDADCAFPCFNSRFTFMRFKGSEDELHVSDPDEVEITQLIFAPQKYLALDFMGTMNHPKAKGMIWKEIQSKIISGDARYLKEAGLTEEQIKDFRDYIKQNNCSPMQLRNYALEQEGVKAAIGRYNSIAAEQGQLDFCKITDDAMDFLALANILDHKVEIFSTIGAPAGYKSVQQILLEQQKLSPGYALLTGKETAFDLVTGGIIVSKLKKSKPGQAVLEEARNNGLDLYVDDDKGIIDAVVATYSSQESAERQILPVLCRLEREGVKEPGYSAEKPAEIGEIVVAKTLMDTNLLSKLF